jgi:hypothetical protein
MAVLLRLCDEDREKYDKPDDPEWVRFDEQALDDLDFKTLNDLEFGLGLSLEFLFRVDKVAQTARWTAARVWLARKMAGVDTPEWDKFDIKVRKVQVKQEKAKAGKAKAGDVDPPDSSPSSEAEASGTESA